ncbi:hypothetical protein B9Z55_000283 [Caenorhabditis nigoni]|uniref:Uncharacterized protein n=1 Tax=Caenorhabditis nigoni TaxID=1611254 RepID=A0A2G5VM72_9PELO|nr:hypothetical protein B9Z55_000283 [Caenorhabditis nigoni]
MEPIFFDFFDYLRCRATLQELKGCYSCSEGAKIAELKCPSSLECSKTGTINEVFLYTSRAGMDWNCEVSCGNGSSVLRRKSMEQIENKGQCALGTQLANAVSTFFGGLLKWISSISVVSLVFLIVLIFLLY